MSHKFGSGVSLIRFLPVIAVAVALASCSSSDSTPGATSFPPATQQRITAAGNWQMIAAEMWGEINQRMTAAGLGGTMIGLEPPAQKTPFNEALSNFLYTDIINSGIGVSSDAPFTLTYTVQVINYGSGGGSTGSFATSTADSIVDFGSSSSSDTEIIVTFSVTDNSSVRLRASKIYYINDDDVKMYESSDAKSYVNSSPVVTSNWYSDNPHDADHVALTEANQFSLMIDDKQGPIFDINGATVVASQHCQSVGKTHAKFLSEGYPNNDRAVLKATFQCQ